MAKMEYAHMTNLRHGMHMGGIEWKKGMGSWWKESDAEGDLGSQGVVSWCRGSGEGQSCPGLCWPNRRQQV